jgi:sugar phosphate isomerase/epimerase
MMKMDVAGTLARVAEVGYKEVEFAGYFDKSAAEIRDLLARNGLTSPSAHIGLDQMRKDWRRALDDARSIGHRWVIIAWLPEQERRTVDDWKRLIAEFNDAARTARDAGLRFAYHNHDYELTPIPAAGAGGPTIPLDLLFAETDPTLVEFQLDLYWVVKGGGDPSSYFARFGKRIPLVHVKDSAGPPAHIITDVGSGTIDFPRIFADAGGSIKHFYAERDDPTDALASIRSSFEYLKALEY